MIAAVLALDDNTTKVLLALIGLVPSSLAAFYAFRIRLAIKTPSGDRIGMVAEQTHHLTAANTAMLKDVHRSTANGEASAEGNAAAQRG